MLHSLTIAGRYCGPPGSGNGGYTCGRLAALLSPGPVEVTLRLPPPLDHEMQVMTREDGKSANLTDGDRLIATAHSSELAIEVPPVPDLPAVTAAVPGYAGFRHHAFPTCFVCGPQRESGDGLRIFAGPVAGMHLVAAPWTPDARLADAAGHIRPEYLWAALDCPGAFAVGDRENPVVLGRMTARLDAPVLPGQVYRVTGWVIHQAGRKATAGTAIFSADGTCCAVAQAIWIELK